MTSSAWTSISVSGLISGTMTAQNVSARGVLIRALDNATSDVYTSDVMYDAGSFGLRLRQARARSELTQEQLARTIDTSPSIIARYEAGIHVPQDARLLALARVLGVDPGWLRYGDTCTPGVVS